MYMYCHLRRGDIVIQDDKTKGVRRRRLSFLDLGLESRRQWKECARGKKKRRRMRRSEGKSKGGEEEEEDIEKARDGLGVVM